MTIKELRDRLNEEINKGNGNEEIEIWDDRGKRKPNLTCDFETYNL